MIDDEVKEWEVHPKSWTYFWDFNVDFCSLLYRWPDDGYSISSLFVSPVLSFSEFKVFSIYINNITNSYNVKW